MRRVYNSLLLGASTPRRGDPCQPKPFAFQFPMQRRPLRETQICQENGLEVGGQTCQSRPP